LDSGAGIDPISGAGSQDFSQLKEASAVDEKRGGLMRNWKVHQKNIPKRPVAIAEPWSKIECLPIGWGWE
jgi:hypothetical protein